MPVFVEQWYVLILVSLYTLCVITATAHAAGNKVSKHWEGA